MLQLKVVEGGLAKTLSLDAPSVSRPHRIKAQSGGKYAVAIPVEGEALTNFPPGYVIRRVGNDLVLMKDGQEMLVLEGFFAQQPLPEFRLEYDDELLLISADNVDAYPSEGVLFDSFAAEAPAEGAAASDGDGKKLGAWLLGLGLAGAGALGAALGGGKKKAKPAVPVLPEEERPEPGLLAPKVLEMDGGSINAAEAADGTVVQIPGYTGMRAGDTVALNWNGSVITHVVTAADVAAGHVMILVPVDKVGPDGSFDTDYTVSGSDGKVLGKSPPASVVIDTVVPGAPGTGTDNPTTPVNENLPPPVVDEMSGGAINAAEAADGTVVRIASYPNMEAGDTIRLNWNGTAIDYVVTAADVANGEVQIPVDPGLLVDGSFDIDYTVTDRNGNSSGVSPPASVVIDTVVPGAPGTDTDNPTTPINENLPPPVIDEMSGGAINAAEAADGTVVRIASYPNMEAGDTIRLNWNGTAIDYVVTAADVANGEVQIPVDPGLLVDGSFDIDYTVTDRNGNHSGVSPPASVVIDTVVPGAPGTGTDNPTTPVNENLPPPVVEEMSGGAINAAEAADGTVVRIASYPNMEAGDTIRLNWNGTAIDYVVTAADVANGEVQIPVDPGLLVDGSFDIDYTVTDRNGNASGNSPSAPVVVDTAAPLPPVVTGISDDTGLSGSDGVTRDNTLVISGSADADALVTVMIDGTVVGSVVADSSGNWSYDHTGVVLADGDYKITAIQSDKAGNPSAPSGEYAITVDTDNGGTTPLAPPVVTGISDDTGLSGSDGVTRDNTLVISGSADADALVTVMIDGTVVGSVVADSSGNWSYDHTGVVLADGDYKITAIQSDKAGNPSAPSGEYAITVDTDNGGTTPLAPPVVTGISDDTGLSGSDGVTRDNTLVISGSADADALVTVMIDGTVVGSVVADSSGNWSYDHTGVVLADGDYKITAIQSDKAGNPSAPSGEYAITVDTDNGGTTPLAPPVVTGISDDTGLSGSDGVTRDNTLVISGSAEADALVTVMIDGTVVGSVVADSSGNWSYDHTGVVLADGDYKITAIQSDKAGNPSAPSGEYAITVDTDNGGTTPVPPPVVTGISDDTGLSGSDGVTRDNTLVISGSAEADALVTVMIDGTVVGSVVADSSGNWSYDHTGVVLADGDYKITAIQSDKAGNPSAPSGEYAITIDTGAVPLAPPVIATVSDDTGVSGSDRITNDKTLTLTGTAKGGATVYISVDNQVVGSVVADANGTWTYTTTDLADGNHTISASQTDIAGNVSGASPPITMTIDTLVAPPTIVTVSDDTGVSSSDRITHDNTLTLSGKAEPGATVEVLIGAGVVGSAIADANGDWTFTTTAQSDGEKSITVRQTDVAGNISAASPPYLVTVDTQVAAPTIESVGTDTGVSGTDKVTSDNTLEIQGKAESGATVFITIDSQVVGSAVADSNGQWRFTTSALSDGQKTISATQIDVAGNASAPSLEYKMTVDTTVLPPTIDNVGTDTGVVGDRITADNTLLIQGSAEPGAMIDVLIGGVSVGTVVADASGQWSLLTNAQTDGLKQITAIQTDVAGNTSQPSTEYAITVDTAVLPPTILSVGSDSGVPGDRITNDNTLQIQGKAEPGATVDVRINNGSIGTAIADANGNWTFTTNGLPDGDKLITAAQTDVAGNVSGLSPPYMMTIDTQVAPPTIESVGVDTGVSSTDRITNDATMEIHGKAEKGATVDVLINGTKVGTAIADVNGDWKFITSAQSDGIKQITAVQTDLAGNTSVASPPYSMTIDTQVAPPVIDSVGADTGVVGDRVTADNTLTITGRSEPGATVDVRIDGASVGTAIADGMGNWTLVTSAQSDGNKLITAVQTDVAGNVSQESPSYTLTIDTQVAPPTIHGIGTDTGVVGDRITSDNTLLIQGKAEAGATVDVRIDNVSVGTAIADINGNWNFTTLPLADGARSITAVQTDIAGNVSQPSTQYPFTIDTQVAAPTIENVSNDSNVVGDRITNDNTLFIEGKAEEGATVEIRIGGVKVGTALADASGRWTYTTPVQSDGVKSITAIQTDVAGNTSSPSTAYEVTVDTTVLAPTIDSVGTDTGVIGDRITADNTLDIEGRAEPGATVQIRIDGVNVGTAIAGPNGIWNFTTLALTDGTKSITAVQTDVAGNTSPPSTAYDMTISTGGTLLPPTIDSVGDDTGVSSTDRITKDNTLDIFGQAEAGATVDVYIDGNKVGSAVADGNGSWRFTTSAQSDGTRLISAVQTDVAGNVSAASPPYSVTIDTQVAAPTIDGVLNDTGVQGDGITADNTLQVSGKAEPGATVEVRINGSAVGTAIADLNGEWRFTTNALSDGDKSITAVQTDIAGNTSGPSNAFAVKIDTQVAAPTIESVGDDTGQSGTDRITADNTLDIRGKAESGATVDVRIDGVSVGTAIADVNGNWQLITSAQADGVRSITATQTDVAGNVSPASPPYTMTIDTAALAPTIDTVTNDTGVQGDRITSDNTLTIGGAAEQGATVEIRVDGAVVGTAIADANGRWTFTTGGLSDGDRSITARQTDVAGNVSPVSPAYDVRIDTQVAPPTIESVSNDTGVSASDKVTSDNTLDIRGKAEPGATVQVSIDGNPAGVAVADINGNWLFTTSGLADGARSITAVQTDVAGNVSPASPAYVMRIDTQVAPPTIDSVGTDTGVSSTDRITRDNTLELQGQAEAGATVDVYIDGIPVGTAIADINGIWRFTTTAQADGDRSITVVQTDIAGNVSVPSTPYVIKIDTQVSAPTIDSVGTDSGVVGDRITNDSTLDIRGKAEPGATVDVRIDGTSVGTAIADGQGNWVMTTSSLSDGDKSITTIQTDVAGNVSGVSPPYTMRIDTQVAAPIIVSVGSDSGVVGDRVTNDNTLEIRGKAEAGASVDVRIGGVSVGTAIADGNGDWVLVTPPQSDGSKSITAVQTDIAGNVSGPSTAYTVTVDTQVLPPTIESVGTDTGVSATDNVTRDNTLQIDGKAEAGATVEVFIDGSRVGTAVADAGGNWRFTTPAQSDGSKSITAIQTDVAGNVSVASPPYTMLIDTTVAAPIIDSVGSDTGVIGDHITADNTLEIVGRAEPGASVDIRINGTSVGTAIADGSGIWRMTTAPLPDGHKSITAVQTDVAGNVSVPSTAYDMEINTGGALLPPIIVSVGDDTGVSATDKITKDNTLDIEGSAQAGATVEIFIDGSLVGTAIANSSGIWTFATSSQTDGTKLITAVQTDVAGNRSGVSPPYSVTIDTQVAAPTIESVGTDTGVSGTDGITRDTTLEIRGKAEGGALVVITVDGQVVGSTVADGVGNWTYTTSALPEGTREIRATQTDIAGNTSLASPPVTMTIDTTVAPPIIDTVGTDTGVSGTDRITNDNTLMISGRAEGGATVEVRIGGTVVGTAIANASGAWTFVTSAVTDGVKDITAVQTDIAGNQSGPSTTYTVTVDTQVAAPTIEYVGTDTGVVGDHITADNTLEIRGKAEPGATVDVRINGISVATVIADNVGNWTFTTLPLPDGLKSITAVQTDVAGNQSAPSTAYDMTVNAGPLPAPIIDSVGTDTGASSTDRVTNDNTLQIEGRAEAGATVEVRIGGVAVGTAIANGFGQWTFTTSGLGDGTHDITAIQTGVSGTQSPESTKYTMTVDTVVAPPIIDSVGNDTGVSNTDKVTNDNILDITGRAEAGATVEVRINGTVVGTAIANGSGVWTLTTSAQSDGVKSITATQTDIAGNVSAASPPYTMTIDTTVAPPTIESVGADSGVPGDRITNDNTLQISGKAEGGATVFVTIDGSVVGSVVADSSGNWSYTTSALADGARIISATQTDVAGNVSPASPPYTMTIDTTPVSTGDLLAPVIDEMSGGSINEAEAADGTVVRIPGYPGMAVGEVIQLNWNGTTITQTVTSADVAAGEVRINVPSASLGPDGSFIVDYVVTDLAGNASGASPGTQVVLDAIPPAPVGGAETNNRNGFPDVQQLADGGWIVSWSGQSSADNKYYIYQQRFDSHGNQVGGESKVSTSAAYSSESHYVVGLSNGGWAVAYMAPDFTTKVKQFDAAGNQVGTEKSLGRMVSAMEALPDGGYLVKCGATLTRFDAFGGQVGSYSVGSSGNFYTNPGDYVQSNYDGLTVLADGGWIVHFTSNTGTSGAPNGDVYFQRYNADGSLRTGNTGVAVNSSVGEYFVDAVSRSDGGWVTAISNNSGFWLQRYNSDGTLNGSRINVAAVGGGHSYAASDADLLALNGGEILFVWEYSGNIYQQLFSAAGVPVGPQVLVTSGVYEAGGQYSPHVTLMDDGGWIVVWRGAGPGAAGSNNIYQQRFDSTGKPVELDGSPMVTTFGAPEAQAFADVSDDATDELRGEEEPAQDVASSQSDALAAEELLLVQLLAASAADESMPEHASIPHSAEPGEVVPSEEVLVEKALAQLSVDDGAAAPAAAPDEALLAEAMQAPEPETLDGLLDEVIGEPAPATEVSAPQVQSEPVLIVPPKTGEFESDDGLTLR